MITEVYVSFEIAKLLKEKGFDEPCECAYSENGQYVLSCYKGIANKKVKNSEALDFSYSVVAPTHQMAMKWLRETHGIDIIIEITNPKNRKYYCIMWDGNNDSHIIDLFNSYEEAVEAALEYSLVIII